MPRSDGKTFPYMEKLLQAQSRVFRLEFFHVLYIVCKVVAKGKKCRLNHIATTSVLILAVEKPFPYMEKLLQAPSRDVSARIFSK